MRRAVLTVSGTVAGLAALFSFKTHVPGITPAAAASTPAGLSVSAPPSPTASAPATPSASPSKTVKKTAKKTAPKTSSSPTASTMTHPATTTTTTTPPPKSSAPAAPSGTFTGGNESTNYGPVQVKITVANGKITAANDVQQPSDGIAANAVSQLNSEVLTAQSANIQAVSGATYTSQGYIGSLQQAVNQAGL